MIGKILIVIVLIGAVAVIGPCVYYGFIAGPDTGAPDMPDRAEATHEFYIENTGGLYLSSDYEQKGDVIGKRIYILHGYWETRGSKFKFVDSNVILNENVFGEIVVNRRIK